jgi:hypothetical protein
MPPGLRDAFETCCNVDAVSEDVSFFDNDVADVDADADIDPLLAGRAFIALHHPLLGQDRATGGVDGTAELNQHSVAGAFDDAATMFRDRWLPEFTAAGIQARERSLLVGSHHPAITDNIGREDGGKTALDVLFCHAITRCLAHGECTVRSFECLQRTRKV